MQVRRFFRRLVAEIIHDDIDDIAAMMTYYAIFALFPMLLFILSLTLLVLPAEVLDDALRLATSAVPPDVATVLRTETLRMQQATGAGFAIFGGVVALWGASRGTAALSGALNRVYAKAETRPWWRRQVLAIWVTFLVAVLVVLALGLLVVGSFVGDLLERQLGLDGGLEALWELGRWLGAGLVMTLLWSLMYKLLPDTAAPLRVFTPGAAIGVLLWILVSQAVALFATYLADYQATYGALAGAITFMLWLWLSNLALLVGAEINDVLAELRRDDSRAARQLDTPTAPEPEPQAAPAEGVAQAHGER